MATGKKSDLLIGVKAIGTYLNMTRPQAQHRIDNGTIPVFRLGGTICTRESTLDAWLTKMMEGAG